MLKQNSYKSPVRILANFFESSRDNWKEKYKIVKNEFKLQKIRVDSLEASKQKWKSEALLLRKQLKQAAINTRKIIAESENIKQNFTKPETPLKIVKIPYHSYSATTIFLMLQLVLNAAVSLRGSSRVLTIVNDVFGKSLERVPSWYSVRSWLLRVGYYKLMRVKTFADDWCWIIDHTIQLGKTKCLFILGIRLSKLPKGRSLQYQDLEPIDLQPVETSNGKVVWKQLENIAAKTGVPRVIVSDFGSDLKAGIAEFCNKHDSCVSIYDIKHKTACLLKAELTKDDDWQTFIKQATKTKNQLQQTPLSHLKPPNQRSKARYMNVEILLRWGFETLKILGSDKEFNEAEKKQLPKLEWLKKYQNNFQEWDELLQVSTLTEKSVRQEGITRDGFQTLERQFQEQLPGLKYAPAIKLKSNLINFVQTQGGVCKGSERLLGSSEIIESVFGKQKYLEQDYAKEGFSSLILGIGAFVGTLSVEDVRDALISTPVKKVLEWCKDKLGETLQSKKNIAYSEVRNGTKIDLNANFGN